MADRDDIAQRAYRLWEERGRPEGRDQEFWHEAEAKVTGANGVALTNLDRALSPAERSRARHERQGISAGSAPRTDARPAAHFIAVIDRTHFRIYSMSHPTDGGAVQFQLAEAFDLPAGRQQYTDRDSDVAGNFPGGSGRTAGAAGGSIDERLPMQNEHQRRLVTDLARSLTRFLEARPDAVWDFAAGPGLHQAVLAQLPPPVKNRLGVALVKELSHQTPAQLRAHLGL